MSCTSAMKAARGRVKGWRIKAFAFICMLTRTHREKRNSTADNLEWRKWPYTFSASRGWVTLKVKENFTFFTYAYRKGFLQIAFQQQPRYRGISRQHMLRIQTRVLSPVYETWILENGRRQGFMTYTCTKITRAVAYMLALRNQCERLCIMKRSYIGPEAEDVQSRHLSPALSTHCKSFQYSTGWRSLYSVPIGCFRKVNSINFDRGPDQHWSIKPSPEQPTWTQMSKQDHWNSQNETTILTATIGTSWTKIIRTWERLETLLFKSSSVLFVLGQIDDTLRLYRSCWPSSRLTQHN